MAAPAQCAISSPSCFTCLMLQASLTILRPIMLQLTRFPVRLNVCSRTFVQSFRAAVSQAPSAALSRLRTSSQRSGLYSFITA
jgi:hypothetical protein